MGFYIQISRKVPQKKIGIRYEAILRLFSDIRVCQTCPKAWFTNSRNHNTISLTTLNSFSHIRASFITVVLVVTQEREALAFKTDNKDLN